MVLDALEITCTNYNNNYHDIDWRRLAEAVSGRFILKKLNIGQSFSEPHIFHAKSLFSEVHQ
jgi:hypothetical protein